MAAEESIDFRGERSRHRYFLGREDVLAEIDRALFDGPLNGRWVLVTGNPGMGKSALLSACVDRVKARLGSEPPHHFLRRGQLDWDRPGAVVRSLAAKIEALFPEQTKEDVPPELRLSKRLAEVSEKVLVPKGQRLVLVVDGLDEVQGSEGTVNPLPFFLPAPLPRGVVVLCASRPVYPHLAWIESQGNVFPIDLGDERWLSSNEKACRELLRVRAAELSPALEPGFVEAAATRAEGNLLYADRLVEWLRSQPVERRRVELLPRGIEAFLTQVWERLRALPKDELEQGARGLGVLCAAREALPLSALGAAAGWPLSDLDARDRFLRATRTLLLKEEAPPGGDGEAVYRPYHESFRAFVVQKLGPEVMREYHARLLDAVGAWPARESAGAFERRYALRHALGHAVSARAWDKARALATDVGFLEAACKETGAWALENALAGAASALAGVSKERAAEIADVHRSVRAESHWLGVEPGALPRLVYNRLLCAGWEPSRIAERLRFRDGLPAYRLRRPVRMANEVERTLMGHTGAVNACAITPDGRRIVSASQDTTLKVWDLDSGRLLRSLAGHSHWVTACAITADGRRIVSASNDTTLKVWDLDSGRLERSLEGHSSRVTACAITPDGHRIVSASEDTTLKVWDLDSGRLERSLAGHSSWVTACAITPDGRRIVSASNDTTLKIWDLDSGRLQRSLEGHSNSVAACAITPDGRRIVSASGDTTLKVWDLDSGRLLRSHEGHSYSVTACAITPDGRRIVSASLDTTLKVWDLASGRLQRSLAGHSDPVTACAITPDGCHIVSASNDHTLKVWDLDSGRLLRSLEGHSHPITACVITPDGRRVVSASEDTTLKIWELDSGRLERSLRGHSNWVAACAITPDGRRIVSASWDTTLKVWDLDSGQLQSSFEGHSHSVEACAVTPDGRRIVSGSRDNTLKIWDVATGVCEVTIHGVAPFLCVTVTPDLLCAGNDIGDLWVLETTSPPERQKTTSTPRPLRLFYSYSHKDEALRDELETHLTILKRQNLIEPWHDRRIEPGTNWAGAIDKNLEEADIILLLVSADFIASPYCYEKEMQRALERHHASQARVIPILLRATHFEGAPFEKLHALPKDAKPVTSWKDRDEAWTDVARGLRLVIESLRLRRD